MSGFNLSRRNYLKASIGFIGSVSLASLIGLENLAAPEPAIAKVSMTSEQALQELMAGNERFMAKKVTHPHQDTLRLQEVATGQNPFAAVLSCADSRVPVEIIFDQGLGDMFVVRIAGNVVTPEETGSLEFGTLVLGSKVLMVIGHESCGAVKAAMTGDPVPGEIESVIDQIQPAITPYKGQQTDNESVKKAVEANVLFQMERLKASPVITKLIEDNQLKLVGAYYNLDDGKIFLLN